MGTECTIDGAARTEVTIDTIGTTSQVVVACEASTTELNCNYLDDDGDGAIDEGFPDSDLDGIPDDCDNTPNTACACFDVADVRALIGDLPSYTYQDVPSEGIVPDNQFEGIYTWWDDGESLEIAGVANGEADMSCGIGCFDAQGNGATACQDNSRPELVALSGLTGEEMQACSDVVEAGVQ